MLKDAAMNWVRSNCNHQRLQSEVGSTLQQATMEKVNCWLGIGGGMTRSGEPFLVHSFSREVFIFQLTKSQATALGIKPRGMTAKLDRVPDPGFEMPAPLVSLERFELAGATLNPSEPIVGRLSYEVLCQADVSSYCVQVDYSIPGLRQGAFDFPMHVLWGKGTIDVQFSSMENPLKPNIAYRGPVVLFVRLFTKPPLNQPDLRRPISSTCATLVDLV